jgi:hypothetical protein
MLKWTQPESFTLWPGASSSQVSRIAVLTFLSKGMSSANNTAPNSAQVFFPPQTRHLHVCQISREWARQRSRSSDWLKAGRSRDRIPVRARFSTPVQTGPEAHPASCIMGTGSFLGVKSGRGVTLTPHPLLVPWSRKGRAIPLLPLWAMRPLQSLSACTRVHFTFFFFLPNFTEDVRLRWSNRPLTSGQYLPENFHRVHQTLRFRRDRERWDEHGIYYGQNRWEMNTEI